MKKRNHIIALLQAYLLSLGGMNKIISIVLNRQDGIMIMNLIPVAGLLLLHFFLSNKKQDLNLNKKAMLFVYYIVSVIIVYKYAFRYTTLTYTEVLVYCFIPIYMSFYKVETEKVLKFVTFFSILIVPISSEFFKTVANNSYETIGMGTTYSILPFILAASLHFFYYRHNNAGFLMYIGYAVNVYYFIMAILYGNRGPLVSFVVFGVLVILHKFNADEKMNKNNVRTLIVSVVVGSLVIYVISNFDFVLYSLYNLIKSVGIEISALSKTVKVLKMDNFLNGRDSVFDFTINGIKEHYLIGNGIGTIYYNSFYRIPYPHNLFLQLWYDLGIIVSIPMFYLIGKSAYVTFFKSSMKKDYSVIMILLFVVSIPRLCYSAEFWTDIPFWFLMMYTISPNLYKSRKDGEETESEGAVDNE